MLSLQSSNLSSIYPIGRGVNPVFQKSSSGDRAKFTNEVFPTSPWKEVPTLPSMITKTVTRIESLKDSSTKVTRVLPRIGWKNICLGVAVVALPMLGFLYGVYSNGKKIDRLRDSKYALEDTIKELTKKIEYNESGARLQGIVVDNILPVGISVAIPLIYRYFSGRWIRVDFTR